MLSTKQEALLKLGKDKGYLKLSDFRRIYSSRIEEVKKHLVMAGYLKVVDGNYGRFVLTEKSRRLLYPPMRISLSDPPKEDKYMIILNDLSKRVARIEERLGI